ncbi:hypothetical protein P4679_25825 [Priestia megaterium]|uniref:hypothetical protein n=1 Tax=Priestia megaterium TaxID=1404 RepID=UPI002E1C1F86|nr:hypothetical protein [Priestia megaterium]
MSKAKNSENFDVIEKNKDGRKNTLNVLFDCGDKEGYGVEYSDNETGIASWSFGDNSIESYILAEKLFKYTVDILTELESKQQECLQDPKLPFVEVSLPSDLISAMFSIKNGMPTERDKDDVLDVMKILEEHFDEHPLKEDYVEKVRLNFRWPKETGLWTSLIQQSA